MREEVVEKNQITKEERKTRKKEKKRLKKEKRQERKEIRREKRKSKKSIRKEIKIEKREKNRILNEPPHLTLLEEVGNAITHGTGALLAIIGLVFLLIKSNTTLERVAACFYGGSMFLMMLMSCLYHSFAAGSRVKRLWRRFDYSSIYLLIGGTFAPLLLVYLGGVLGIVLFVIQWALIITGITMVGVFGPGRLRWLHFPLYFVMGWSGLMFIPSWIRNNLNLFWFILSGGVVYTLGMIPFVMRGVKGAHFIWHFFVLAGATVHFIGILLCLY